MDVMMNSVTLFLYIHVSVFLCFVQGQCYTNGTCECHCADTCPSCQSCLPGWNGSTSNFCQKENYLYDAENELLDDDLETFKENKDLNPYILVQLKTSKSINRLSITLQLETKTVYTIYVKNLYYERAPSSICHSVTHNDVSIKKTITVTCKQPLLGKYLEIVPSSVNPNQDIKVYEMQQFECTDGSYGGDCSGICSVACSDQCDKETGDCACKIGYWGNFCNQTCSSNCKNDMCDPASGKCFDCIPGKYGLNCSSTCSERCLDSCNRTSGFCSCKVGFYLPSCSQKCSKNCLDGKCLQESGYCVACVNKTYGDFCEKNCLGECRDSCDKVNGVCGDCVEGKYGRPCNETCPKNCDGSICKRDSGHCEQCKIGFKGNTCFEHCPEHCIECTQNGYKCPSCEDGWYGVQCTTRCQENCGGNGTCDNENGSCHICNVGYFGSDCRQKCNESCDANKMCDKVTGQCYGCVAGRHGPYCENLCSDNCRNFTCLSNETCVNGCKDGWFGSLCINRCNVAVRYCDKCELEDNKPVCQRCDNTTFLNGSKCAKCPLNCSSCISDTTCVNCKDNFLFGETCNQLCNSACINSTCDIRGNCLHGCENSKYGTNCDNDCPKGCKTCRNSSVCSTCKSGYNGSPCSPCPENCEICQKNLTCTFCKSGWTENNGSCSFDISTIEDYTGPASIIIAVLCILLLLLLSGLIFIWKFKQKRKKKIEPEIPIPLLPDLTRTGPLYENTGPSVYATRGSLALLEEIDQDETNNNEDDEDKITINEYVNVKISRISLLSLWEYKLKNIANGDLDIEFQDLPGGLLLRATESKKKENKKRNRYKHIYPYDRSRVVLTTEDGDSSYINASFVNGFETTREYIAAQGPFTAETVVDFWRMVWQENVNTIVILTNLEENGVIKCKRYWPSTEKIYGDLQVKKLSSEASTDYTVRCFQISKEDEGRTIEQFHFTAWPDKGVPSNVNSILEFRKRVKTKSDIANPIVVHCSAGIGRTGTYIALDYLINQGQKDKSVDVMSCVTRLRNDRAHLVQTVEQYIYLYCALTKELTGNQSMMQEDEFLTYYNQMKCPNPTTGQTDLEREFKLIEKLLPDLNENQYQAAMAIENRYKNRCSNILADDNHRVYLQRKGNDYINAIFLPSVLHRSGYIITNTPMKETVEDFFSMVKEQEVYTIVLLSDNDEIPGNDWWMCDNGFVPTNKNTSDSFDLTTCQIYDKQTSNNRDVHLYDGHFWNGKRFSPSGYHALASLVDAVLDERRNHTGHPVLVVCQNGAELSGLFCVLAILVEQIHLFRSVDVLQTVINVRHRRSQIVPCIEQLEYIYDFIEKYLGRSDRAHSIEMV